MTAIHTAIRRLLGLLLLAMVLTNVANAAGRYLFGKAIPGSDELLVFAMIWLVFVGAALVAAQDTHLRFDLLSRVLPPVPRGVLFRFNAIFVALLAGYAATQSWAVLGKLARVNQVSMATGLPMVGPHAAVLLGLACIAVISLWLALRGPATRADATNEAGAS